MSINEMICVICPVGCHLTVSMEGSFCTVKGNQCKRGEDYAFNELSNPLRTVTSTVKIHCSDTTRLPVKTDQAFPKGKMWELMVAIKKVTIKLPVKRGQVVLENVLDSGVNIIATKTILQ